MRKLRILFSILTKSLTSIATLALFIFGSLDTILLHFPVINKEIITLLYNYPLISEIYNWFSQNWIALFFVALSISIFEGFYQATNKYLGETVKANIRLLRDYGKDFNIIVNNLENMPITNCHARVELFKFMGSFKGADDFGCLGVNPYRLKWESVESTNGFVDIRGNNGIEVLQVIKMTEDNFYIPSSGPEPILKMRDGYAFIPAKYQIVIRIDGELLGKPIIPIIKAFELIFELEKSDPLEPIHGPFSSFGPNSDPRQNLPYVTPSLFYIEIDFPGEYSPENKIENQGFKKKWPKCYDEESE
jgi:hypothetical protein